MSELAKLKDFLSIPEGWDCSIQDLLRRVTDVTKEVEVIGIAQRINDELFQVSDVIGNTGKQLLGLEFSIGEGFLGNVVATGQPGYWSGVSYDPRSLFFRQNGVNAASVICYPVFWSQQVQWVLFAVLATESQEETNLLIDVLFAVIGRQLLVDSLEDNLEVRTTRLTSIMELSQAMMEVKDIKNVLYILLDMSLNLVQGPFTCIAYKPITEESTVELLSRGITRLKASEIGRYLADTYIGLRSSEMKNWTVPSIRRLENVDVIECPMYLQDEVIAMMAVGVSDSRKIDECSQLVYVLSVLGNAALQRICAIHRQDWKRAVSLVHSTSAFWDKDSYEHVVALQNMAVAFANNLGLSCEHIQFIEQAALLSPYDPEYIAELIPTLPNGVIELLRNYQLLHKRSSYTGQALSDGAQLLALVEHHCGNTEINIELISNSLQQKFEFFMLQKDVETQEIRLHDANPETFINSEAVSLKQLSIFKTLTAREKDVLSLLVTGKGNKDIAQTLFISEHTVKNHLTNIFQKLGVNDRAQAIAFVFQYMQ